MQQGTWRVGGKVPLNVYENDKPMFQCHTPEDAARIVALLNAALSKDTRRLEAAKEIGRLAADAGIPIIHLDSAEDWKRAVAKVKEYALQSVAGSEDTRGANLAMMLRRFIWQANKRTGDDSMKVLAGKATELLASYGLTGNPLRAAIESKEGR